MSRLGELLVRENLISLSQLQKAQEESRKSGSRLGYSLTKLGYIAESDLTNFLTGYNIEVVVAAEASIEESIVRYYEQAKQVSYDEVMQGFDENEIAFGEDGEDVNAIDLEKQSQEAPVVKLCNLILINAIK